MKEKPCKARGGGGRPGGGLETGRGVAGRARRGTRSFRRRSGMVRAAGKESDVVQARPDGEGTGLGWGSRAGPAMRITE